MRIVVQRVRHARVSVAGEEKGCIDLGFLLLVGVTHEDTESDVTLLVKKVVGLRVFSDENDKMNLSLKDIGGSVLSVSQFTLYGDCRKGNRPSFVRAAGAEHALRLYEMFNQQLEAEGIHVERGEFGAHMEVELLNDGPVTILLETPMV